MGELRVNNVCVDSGIIYDNKATYPWPTGFNYRVYHAFRNSLVLDIFVLWLKYKFDSYIVIRMVLS